MTAEFLISESGGLEPRKGTAWKVHFARGVHKGLYITGAWFKRDLSEDWIKVLNDARIAELFVPYHQSSLHPLLRPDQLFSSPWPRSRPRTPARSARSCRRSRAIRSPRSSRKCATAAWPGRTTPTACAAAASWSSGAGSRQEITCTSCRMLFMTTARSPSAWARPVKTFPATATRPTCTAPTGGSTSTCSTARRTRPC